MKLKIVFLLILLVPNALDLIGQQTGTLGNLLFEDTLSFNPIHEFLSVPDPENNVWQVGIPSGGIIDSTYTGKESIFAEVHTGSENDTLDYFLVSIPAEDNWWGEGILSFYHNYNTDSLINGGLIELSYDNGATWKNILNDKNHVGYRYIGIYSEYDTILGGVPAFSGGSNEWVYTELYWHWIALVKKGVEEKYGTPIVKFSFVRNTAPSSTNTWIIDGLVFRGYSVVGAVDSPINQKVVIYPNPALNELWLQVLSTIEVINYNIYDLSGVIRYDKQIPNFTPIDISILNPGLYFLVAKHEGRVVAKGKFLKE